MLRKKNVNCSAHSVDTEEGKLLHGEINWLDMTFGFWKNLRMLFKRGEIDQMFKHWKREICAMIY